MHESPLLTSAGRRLLRNVRDRIEPLYELGGPPTPHGNAAPDEWHGYFILSMNDAELLDPKTFRAFLDEQQIRDVTGLAALLRLERVEAACALWSLLMEQRPSHSFAEVESVEQLVDLLAGHRWYLE